MRNLCRGAFAILLCTLSLAGVACSQEDEPLSILYDSNQSGNYEMYRMNADGSGVTILGSHPADDYSG